MTLLHHSRKPERTLEWLVVENARLERILKGVLADRTRLETQVSELTQQLGQAAAGMELADLIKRMTG
jgi:predicted nuclease with TOPRIM domain